MKPDLYKFWLNFFSECLWIPTPAAPVSIQTNSVRQQRMNRASLYALMVTNISTLWSHFETLWVDSELKSFMKAGSSLSEINIQRLISTCRLWCLSSLLLPSKALLASPYLRFYRKGQPWSFILWVCEWCIWQSIFFLYSYLWHFKNSKNYFAHCIVFYSSSLLDSSQWPFYKILSFFSL